MECMENVESVENKGSLTVVHPVHSIVLELRHQK